MANDIEALKSIENELGIKIYPGTEVMTDVGRHHFVKSSGKSDRVLVPQPSNDPHDPLNWNRFWKANTMFLTTAMTFAQCFGPMAFAPMFPQLIEEFDTDLHGVVKFTGVCILILGFSNFFWVPVQTCFGRRPVLIFSTAICMVASLWRGLATSYGGFMGASILNGFGAGPAETAQPQIIADVMFLHERGAYQTLYFTVYFASLVIGPVLAGTMAYNTHWRDFWWLNVAMLGFILVLLIFLFPETRWARDHPRDIAAGDTVLDKENTTMTAGPTSSTSDSQPDSPADGTQEKPFTEHIEPATSQEHTNKDQFLGKGKPSKQQFRPYRMVEHPLKVLLIDFWIPWKLHVFPIVHLAAFIVSWAASVLLVVNLTQSQCFAAPPYNFNSQTVGLLNFAVLVGAFIGLATNGKLSDWISMRATRKNRGIREPEMRLSAMIPYVIIMIIGNLVVAFGYEYKWNWKVIVFIGYTAVGIQVAALPAIASTYAVDSYKPVAGSLFVTITINKNLWGYGLAEFITPWTERDGFLPAILLNMALTTFFCACGILFYYKGKCFRRITANSDVHRM
ncbi:hypothetical protein AJ79_03641 [Helicocarpus griseus UAMH5409]|uniref:Major facilitator superfamily (MFS) profile domain-containing protein n=1 Tax=Helicocarpus griseus UAMH5409 TaxID=1447875 RepID=A0A2B7XWX6_9EURO|nr:hypothetical protein AJ79_03641 [Helicocarpus griseus UAMH5409]